MKKMFRLKAKVIKNIEVAPKYYKISLSSAKIAQAALPGQFLEAKVADTSEVLLRRPFSIHRVCANIIEILYEVKGKGTQWLSRVRPGQSLDIIGPLGNGFNYQSSVVRRPSFVLVAGGMGVAPLLFLAQKLKGKNTLVLIGARTKKQILCESEFKKLGYQVKIATDDGSKGFQGRVTDLLRSQLSTVNCELLTIYACGPKPMLRAISAVAGRYNIDAQASLEEHMACGIGACLGCVVKTEEGFKRVCKDGPVFNAKEIVW